MARREPEPVRITTAERSHSDDINARQRRYLISMGVRTVCFILAVVSIGHWFMWGFIIASFILPYVAVIMANAGSSPDPGGPDPFDPQQTHPQLEGPSDPE
ncbi:MAG: DUF3099 domain-containing protein [Nocardioidaceae bacterium]